MDMMEIRHRILLHPPKSGDGPWLDYPTLTYNQQPLICSDGTRWTWNSGNYWEYPEDVQPTMVKAWFTTGNGIQQNLFSNNAMKYEVWASGTAFNFRSNNFVQRNLKTNGLYPVTFDFVEKKITLSDGTLIHEIAANWLPFYFNCIAGRAGATNNNQYLYGIQVWL